MGGAMRHFDHYLIIVRILTQYYYLGRTLLQCRNYLPSLIYSLSVRYIQLIHIFFSFKTLQFAALSTFHEEYRSIYL